MNGGGGYTPDEVGMMSLDQIWFRLVDMDILKNKSGGKPKKVSRLEAVGSLSPDENGLVKGRAADGTPFKARLGGKSVARQLMEREAAKRAAELAGKKKRRRMG